MLNFIPRPFYVVLWQCWLEIALKLNDNQRSSVRERGGTKSWLKSSSPLPSLIVNISQLISLRRQNCTKLSKLESQKIPKNAKNCYRKESHMRFERVIFFFTRSHVNSAEISHHSTTEIEVLTCDRVIWEKLRNRKNQKNRKIVKTWKTSFI